MAKWTLADYIYKVRQRLMEFEIDYFKDTEIMDYINEGINELKEALNLEEYLLVAANNQKTVDLPVNLFKIRVVYVENVRIEYVTVNEKIKSYGVCYAYAGKLQFSQGQNGNVEIYYTRLPKMMYDNAELSDVPEQYQTIPVLYALARCLEKDKNEVNATYYFSQFEDRKAKMLNENRDKFDHFGVAFIRDDAGLGGW